MPEILASDIEDKHVYETCPISFEVTAQGIPRPDAQWLHDGKPIKGDSRVNVIEDGKLYKLDIVEAKLEDAGAYEVVIKNKLGEEVRKAKLNVSRKSFMIFSFEIFRIYFCFDCFSGRRISQADFD